MINIIIGRFNTWYSKITIVETTKLHIKALKHFDNL